jgi:hypothetical protein
MRDIPDNTTPLQDSRFRGNDYTHKKSPVKTGLSYCFSESISPSRAKGEQGIFYGEGVSVRQYAIVSSRNPTPQMRAQQA